VFHNDDTPNKVLELIAKHEQEAAEGTDDERTGAFTSGIVSISGQNKIALFVTGAQHAGENLAAVLKQRAAELPVPIQMSDCLSANAPGEFKTILSACISHSRRKYVDVAVSFPGEVRYVLETLAGVDKNDAAARQLALSHRRKWIRSTPPPKGRPMEDGGEGAAAAPTGTPSPVGCARAPRWGEPESSAGLPEGHVLQLFSTHPPVEERVRRLQSMAQSGDRDFKARRYSWAS
jgi:hypothetical protein